MANVSRIIAQTLPKDANVSKEARVALSACATVFVHYVTELCKPLPGSLSSLARGWWRRGALWAFPRCGAERCGCAPMTFPGLGFTSSRSTGELPRATG